MTGTTGSDTSAELSLLQQKVLDAIDDDRVVQDLRDLVAIPSIGGSGAEAEAQEWCAARLAELGCDVDRWDIDLAALSEVPGHPGAEVERWNAVGCVGVLGGTSQPASGGAGMPALALCAHTDVVPPGDLMSWPDADPFSLRIIDGLAHGRGACDMKGGLAAILGAVSALSRSGMPLRRPLAVHTVSGEEDGGLGAFATLRRGHLADACVIVEPTARTIIPLNAGSLTFRLDVTGRSTHGATRTQGVSVIDLLEDVQATLRRLERDRNADLPPEFAHLDLAWPISIGRVEAGDWASSVPDRLVAHGRFGVQVGEDVDTGRRVFEHALADAGAGHPWLRDHPVEVTWPGGEFASGSLPEGHRLLGDVASAVMAVGDPRPEVRGAPYGSDLRHYAAAGVPTLQYGPGDIRCAHALDERVEVAEVLRCARVYALLALAHCV
ncbi:MAG TPA: ArgE/DapE family deacylase [Segeticoccus sp.]|jgi:acetylornithine deacetylase|nr:ArgE/DapE family deacylase [Segeticoccus sp.]